MTGVDESPRANLAATPASAPEAERREITVMFCDLVGSTPLSERLDPEDLRDVVGRYQDVCAGVVAVHGGHIAQYLGDGLLVYFGYPHAHEDDARRAMRAGLGIVEAVRMLATSSRPADPDRLAVRIGIHTGPVVVGRVGVGDRSEDLAIGETPNVANRVQAMADTNTVVVSAVSHRLARGFSCESLGVRTLRGVSQPLELFRVLAEAPDSDVATTEDGAGPTPLVGREAEIGLLLSRWQLAKEGRGQMAVLIGEPGIGKSRLVQALRARLAGEPHAVLETRGSPYSQSSALHGTIDLLRRLFGFQAEDGPDERRARIIATLEQHRLPIAPTLPLLASLLSLTDEAPAATTAHAPQARRQQTLEAIVRLVVASAQARPVVLIVEDLHWVDPSTLEVLTRLGEQARTAAVLMLLTARPEFASPWPPLPHVVPVALTRLSREACRTLVERMAGGKMVPGEVLDHIVLKTDGVPLFVEELTNTVLESGLLREHEDRWELTGPLAPLAIPATLRGLLMARLDRQDAAKSIAQVAAVLGRQFSHELLRAVWPADEDALEHGLRRLVTAELLYPLDAPPRRSYAFKHALIQDVAYESLLRATRQRYHRRTAEAMVERFPDTAETQPELVAHHFTEAGLTAPAITYWRRASQRAVERSATKEAIGHFRRALDLLRRGDPEAGDHVRLELELQTAMGAALMAADGYAAPEVERAYERARDLCERLGDEAQLFATLRGLWGLHFVRANLERAHSLAQQCLTLAGRSRPIAVVWSHYMLGATKLELGRPAMAQAHFDAGLATYDAERRPVQRALQDPGVACLSYRATALWLQGHPGRARDSVREAIALAEKLLHPFSLAYALGLAAVISQFCRQVDETHSLAAAATEIASEHGLAYFQAWGTMMKGWAVAAGERTEDGIAELRRGLAAYRATGAAVAEPYFLALLADSHRRAARIDEGLETVQEALAVVDRTAERWIEGELHRLQGELVLRSSRPDAADAERQFRLALRIARDQGETSIELRAATSLGRLWRSHGRAEEARALVTAAYGRFTEGFETADLADAKALLDDL